MTDNLFDPGPSLSVEKDETIVYETDFDNRCRAELLLYSQRLNWTISRSLTTMSKAGQLIWRADFTVLENDKSVLINRLVCWMKDNDPEVYSRWAFGQKISPLPEFREG